MIGSSKKTRAELSRHLFAKFSKCTEKQEENYMRSVRRTTWRIKHEIVTVVRCRSYGAANAEAVDGFETPETEAVEAREITEQLAISDGNCIKAINKREKDHE